MSKDTILPLSFLTYDTIVFLVLIVPKCPNIPNESLNLPATPWKFLYQVSFKSYPLAIKLTDIVVQDVAFIKLMIIEEHK